MDPGAAAGTSLGKIRSYYEYHKRHQVWGKEYRSPKRADLGRDKGGGAMAVTDPSPGGLIAARLESWPKSVVSL